MGEPTGATPPDAPPWRGAWARLGRTVAGALALVGTLIASLAPVPFAVRSVASEPVTAIAPGDAAVGSAGDPATPMARGLHPAVGRCLACHLGDDGALDIVGLDAMRSLPPEWTILWEDAFDLDGDGIAGTMRYVSGGDGPIVGLYGSGLAAGRLEDFARIAGVAHGIDVSDPTAMNAVLDAFLALSPDPAPMDPLALARFEARGCTDCHVTHEFEHEGRAYAPLSDFLLHDLGEGPVRTAPLWGCGDCLEGVGHGKARKR